MPVNHTCSLSKLLGAAAILVACSTAAHAVTFSFDTDPFAGTTALQTPGRQIIGNEQFIAGFQFPTDVISVNGTVFNIQPTITFFNGLASDLPTAGRNVVVLQTLDGDGDATNGNQLAAGTAANLIANQVTQAGAGLFVYFNSALSLTRLVYSTDLDSSDADLKILARFTDQAGQAGIDSLPNYTAANFAVPEPASVGLLLAGVAGLVFQRRRRATAAPAGLVS